MALSDYIKRGQIGPSHKGSFYTYERNGRWVIAKWPKKRGKPRSQVQALTQTVFKAVCDAIKHTAAEVQTFHRENAKGTPMLPRDTLMAALYGNGPTITYYSGKVIKPMANRLLASTVLDAMAWAPGSLLFRGEEYWEAIPPGAPGQILVSGGATEAPYWGSGGAAGSGPTYTMAMPGTNSTSAYCLKGNVFQPVDGLTLAAVYVPTQALNGDVQSVTVVLLDAANLVTAIPRVVPAALVGNGVDRLVRVDIDPPLRVSDGQKFGVLVKTEGKAANFATRIKNGAVNGLNWPMSPGFGYVMMTKNTIAIGDVLSVTAGEIYQIGMRVY